MTRRSGLPRLVVMLVHGSLIDLSCRGCAHESSHAPVAFAARRAVIVELAVMVELIYARVPLGREGVLGDRPRQLVDAEIEFLAGQVVDRAFPTDCVRVADHRSFLYH